MHQPFVVVVDSHGDDLLGHVLTDDILIKEMLDLGRLKKVYCFKGSILLGTQFLVHNGTGLFDAIIAYMAFKAGDKQVDLFFGPAAE